MEIFSGELPSAFAANCGSGKDYQKNSDGFIVYVGAGNTLKDGIKWDKIEADLNRRYSALDVQLNSLSGLNAYVAQQITLWNKSTG